MGTAGTFDAELLRDPARLELQASDLAVFFLNVGDGDSIVLRFPMDGAAATLGSSIVSMRTRPSGSWPTSARPT